ncbi:uncharacterized protein BCR38DRAFT_487199 [Pseudomassariella vexata]|uniref:Uncharacterized protein n=1 Tax=Pseudomassariella vexata TaxID=1141098 RepID=A0A1Y2DQN2_9PEZI|nr:uncharacterized protein BCR38DRAFT_487199 [Pseudomassariella vexata]ORY61444.1 hypothetical protein BCR38DRAFT_487199 [Pseudomassariella vexata]
MATLSSRARASGVLRSLLSQASVWAISIFAIAASSVLLGIAVAMNIKNPIKVPDCTSKQRDDPQFWQVITQLLLHVLLVLCIVVPVLRDHEKWVKVHRFLFYTSVAVSIVSEVLSLVLYGTICGSNGWLAGFLLDWAARVTAAAAAAQLAGGIRRG